MVGVNIHTEFLFVLHSIQFGRVYWISISFAHWAISLISNWVANISNRVSIEHYTNSDSHAWIATSAENPISVRSIVRLVYLSYLVVWHTLQRFTDSQMSWRNPILRKHPIFIRYVRNGNVLCGCLSLHAPHLVKFQHHLSDKRITNKKKNGWYWFSSTGRAFFHCK